MGAKLLTRRELAAELGKNMGTITKWEQQGLPVREPGRKGKASLYSLADATRWLEEREANAQTSGTADLARERARKERAQARYSEIQGRLLAGELVPVNEIERAWINENIAVKSKFLSFPAMYADQLCSVAELEGPTGVESFLRSAIETLLLDLSHTEPRPELVATPELEDQAVEDSPPSRPPRGTRKK